MNNLTTALSLGRLAICANTLESWPTLVQENVSPLSILLPPSPIYQATIEKYRFRFCCGFCQTEKLSPLSNTSSFIYTVLLPTDHYDVAPLQCENFYTYYVSNDR